MASLDLPYRCPRCGEHKRFRSLSSLRAHLEYNHTYETLYVLSKTNSICDAAVFPLAADGALLAPAARRDYFESTSFQGKDQRFSCDLVPADELEPAPAASPSPRYVHEIEIPLSEIFTRGKAVAPAPVPPAAMDSAYEEGLARLKIRAFEKLEVDKRLEKLTEEVEQKIASQVGRLQVELDRKSSELEKAKQESLRLSREKQELEDRASELSRQVDVSVEMLASLKQDLVQKEQELTRKQQEVLQIDQFLKETAAREANAKVRLQHFIEELLDRADRAEKQLQIISSSCGTTPNGSLGRCGTPGSKGIARAAPLRAQARLRIPRGEGSPEGSRQRWVWGVPWPPIPALPHPCPAQPGGHRPAPGWGQNQPGVLGTGWGRRAGPGGQPGCHRGPRAREVLQIDQFLKETAAREANAKVRLQHFIEELLDRADRAEKQLQIISSSCGTTPNGSLGRCGTPGSKGIARAAPLRAQRERQPGPAAGHGPYGASQQRSCSSTGASSRAKAVSQSSGCYDSDSAEPCPAEQAGEGPPYAARGSGLRRQAIHNWHRRPYRNSTEGEEGDVSDVGSRTTESEAEGWEPEAPGCAAPRAPGSCRLTGLEAGLESLLKATGSNLLILRISHCPNVLTDRSLWLASCYCRALQAVTYRSSTDPVGHEVIWALGAGCRDIISLQVAPLHPCQQPTRFSNRCLQMIGRCWPHLRALGVGGAGCGLQGLASLARNCMRLQVLELDHVAEINQEVAAEVCREGLKGLEMLVLTSTPVTPKALLHFNSVCRNLKSIVVQVGIVDYFKEPHSPEARRMFEEMVNKLQALRKRPGFSKILHIKVEGGC
ncbi:F-box only protein 41 [Passer montanus]|uniref:F-box only protein 41 n=1 Tax=Passer montanus TaxID=9160 RepID=UPI001960F27F|nr:F-box only protein 41 [Passer montanus]